MISDTSSIRAEEKGLAFNYEEISQLPAIVYGDEMRLRQVLLNLLGNAAKFTERGTVALKVGRVVGHPDSSRLRFEVKDVSSSRKMPA